MNRRLGARLGRPPCFAASGGNVSRAAPPAASTASTCTGSSASTASICAALESILARQSHGGSATTWNGVNDYLARSSAIVGVPSPLDGDGYTQVVRAPPPSASRPREKGFHAAPVADDGHPGGATRPSCTGPCSSSTTCAPRRRRSPSTASRGASTCARLRSLELLSFDEFLRAPGRRRPHRRRVGRQAALSVRQRVMLATIPYFKPGPDRAPAVVGLPIHMFGVLVALASCSRCAGVKRGKQLGLDPVQTLVDVHLGGGGRLHRVARVRRGDLPAGGAAPEPVAVDRHPQRHLVVRRLPRRVRDAGGVVAGEEGALRQDLRRIMFGLATGWLFGRIGCFTRTTTRARRPASSSASTTARTTRAACATTSGCTRRSSPRSCWRCSRC